MDAPITTENHSRLTADHDWVPAGDVRPGERVVRLDGTTALAVRPGVTDYYNLTVSVLHTYAVGTGQFAVHNTSGPCGSGATFGQSDSTNYRATLFAAHPDLEGQVVVHHPVEQQVLTRFPGVVTESEIHSLENLRRICAASQGRSILKRI